VRCCMAQDMENEEAKDEEPENSRVSLTAEVRLGINASSALRRNVRRGFGDTLIADGQRAAQVGVVQIAGSTCNSDFIALQPETGPIT